MPKPAMPAMPASARALLDAAPSRSRSPSSSQQRHVWDTTDVAVLRQEQALAKASGVPWRERGPPGPPEEGPEVWRGQKFRQGSNRYANRGGKQRAYFAAKYGGSKGGGKGGGGKGKGGGKGGASASGI